jgi:hypothetical protein
LRGKLYVIDANNSSATFEFAQTVQQNKLGTLIGQPTGGNQRGINGGAFFFLLLPKTQIEMDLPLVGNFPSSPQPDPGLAPDILVTLLAGHHRRERCRQQSWSFNGGSSLPTPDGANSLWMNCYN